MHDLAFALCPAPFCERGSGRIFERLRFTPQLVEHAVGYFRLVESTCRSLRSPEVASGPSSRCSNLESS